MHYIVLFTRPPHLMKILNAQQIKRIDELTLAEGELTSIELTERAATQCTRFILNHYPDRQRPVQIFCGPGNNGGDGLAIARQLIAKGYTDVNTYLFNIHGKLSANCQANAERLHKVTTPENFIEVRQQFEAPQCTSRTLIVDALFGSGLNRPLSGGYAALVQFINGAKSDVISIDIPSGMMCEDNTENTPDTIVRATHTLTFQLHKLAFMLPDMARLAGEVHVSDIGLSEEAISQAPTDYVITSLEDIRPLLRPRDPFGHKGTFGHALLIAGQYGMAGAAVLAARACLRSGAGKVTAHTPQRNNDILQIAVPEVLTSHDAHDSLFTTTLPTSDYSSVGIGPGIGTDRRTALALIGTVSRCEVPLVLDADALNILSAHQGWLDQVPQGSILTPHPAEMRRLSPCPPGSFSILQEARRIASQMKCYVLLKGHRTALCTPSGHVYFNPTGNAGMATAGSGDVLTGLLTGLLAQGYHQEEACRLGVYLHGLAGDLAAEALGEESVTASDIISYLPQAFRNISIHKQ